jgi:hypothetical protein
MPRFVGLLFLACTVVGCRDSTGPDGLKYELRTTVVSETPMVIETSIIARNTSDRTIHVDRNTCPSGISIFRTADRTGTAEWSSNGENVECAAWAGPLDLAPGDFYEFALEGTLPSSIPDGLHFLQLDIFLGRHIRLPGGQIVTGGGSVWLP